ncbi:methylenetetrahydrofolate reductase C-terminal domain-containing protein [Chloroflexota bacterium]
MHWLQDHPHLLEIAYHTFERMLGPFQRWLVPSGWTERVFVNLEIISKVPLFDCRMCGQCVLHSTGMTCPMTCPKTMRNGPCGGVLMNGNCEVKPEMPCVWVQAWQRSNNMGEDGNQIRSIQPPLNNRLQGTSAWINDMNSEIQLHPKGWEA